jgi:hypothetical protein
VAISLGYIPGIASSVRKKEASSYSDNLSLASGSWLMPIELLGLHEYRGLDRRRVSKYRFWFFLSILVSQAAIFSMYHLAWTPTITNQLFLILICTSVVLVSNHVVAAQYREHRLQAYLASLIAAIIALVATDHFTPLSQKLMGLYGFGRCNDVDITLSEEGVKTAKRLQLIDSSSDDNRICGVEILSQVGSHYLLRLQGGRSLDVPKSSVESWIRKPPPKGEDDKCP